MKPTSEFMLRAIELGRKHAHVNAINTFSRLAASALHETPIEETIAYEIKEYEAVIETLKSLRKFEEK